MANWAALPADLLRLIVSFFLITEDIDYYLPFRAVCQNWRYATAGPTADGTTAHGATDPLFVLTKWAIIEQSLRVNAGVTFVNLATGRFVRKRIPALLRYFFLGATGGGLLVLGDGAPPHQTRVLNPFTGAMARFNAPVVREEVSAVAVTPSSLIVFISGRHNDVVMWADRSSHSFYERRFTVPYPEHRFTNMTPCAGEVHAANSGSIFSTANLAGEAMRSAQTITMADTVAPPPAPPSGADSFYLVESEGELLLVSRFYYSGVPQIVYRADMANRVLEPVASIGDRALFVSPFRCVSADAGKFPGVEPGCVYYVDLSMIGRAGIKSYVVTVLRLADRWSETVVDRNVLFRRGCFLPATLVQLFAEYCRFIGYPGLGLAI